ncbi:MAG: metal-sensitive transcriptional regulator [Candidatus Gracilibacteria bacterium]
MATQYKQRASLSTKKAIGQLKKVLSMIEGEDYCMDIVQQVRAVKGLLDSVSLTILENHMVNCSKNSLSGKDRKVVDEMMLAFKAMR